MNDICSTKKHSPKYVKITTHERVLDQYRKREGSGAGEILLLDL